MVRKKQAGKPADREKPFARIIRWIRSDSFRCALIIFFASLIAFGLYCTVCAPKQYDLSVGSISHETINATKDVIDEVTTEEKRQAAAAAVEPTYTFKEGVKEEVLTSLNSVFSELRTVQQYAATLQSEEGPPQFSFSDTEIEYAIGLVTTLNLSRYQVSTLLKTTSERFEEMVSLVTTAVENSLNTTIREGQVNQSIQTILQIVGYKLDVSLTQTIVPTVLRTCIQPNMIIEQEATEIARQKARDNVEPVIYLQGQNIVRQGDRVTKSQLEMLRSLGLLKNNAYDFSSYLGAFLIVLISMICFVLALRLLQPEILSDSRKTAVVMLVSVLGLGIGVISHLFFSAYLVPVAFVPLLLTVLLGSGSGYASIIPLSVLISGLAAGNSTTYQYEMILLLLMGLTSGVICVRFMKGHPQRVRVLLAGLLSAVVNAVSILSVAWMTSSDTFNPYATLLWALGGGVLSGSMAIAFQPVFENIFRLATPSKLLELSNPNQPLLRRLLLEAPGTYHHAIIVANLAEAAAGRIGANPYLARAAGYYHDIGKLKRPMYFKENQMGDNPHDRIDPYISAAILTSHTRDGYQLALKERLPREIMDIILQHHGDTPVMFFYHKALQMSDGTPVDINEFRYEGPRPNTREAAIVMLADTIEAAVRSMKDPTPKAIDQFIEQLVRGKLEDGQLSDSPITLRDIDDICDAFTNVLMGVFHERIEYPQVRHRVPQNAAHARPAAEQEPQVQAAQPLAPVHPVQPAPEPVRETAVPAEGSGPQKAVEPVSAAAPAPEKKEGEGTAADEA